MGTGQHQPSGANSVRASLQDAIRTRLERVASSQKTAVALEPRATEELRGLTALLRDDDGDLQSRHLLGWLHWYRYLALSEEQDQDQDDLRAAVAMFTPCFIAGVDSRQLPEPLLATLADHAVPPATSLLQQALTSADLHLISFMSELWRRIATAIPAGDPNRSTYLDNFGCALQLRFERAGVQADLDEAVRVGREAVAATPSNDPDRAGRLSNLGNALQLRFQRTGVHVDLDQAIALFHEAAVAKDNPNHAMFLSNLGNAQHLRFRTTGLRADLDEAVRLSREAVAATPTDHSSRGKRLSNLSAALFSRFERAGVQADLDEAVRTGREAVAATPSNDPSRAGYLSNLGNALQTRFEQNGVQADLDEAVRVGREAVTATPTDDPNRTMYLSNLGNALQLRFERAGVQADLDEAVRTDREAVAATPIDHPDRAARLSSLGQDLGIGYKRTGAESYLDEAIATLQEVVDIAEAAPSIRVRAARAAGLLAAETDPSLAAQLLERGVWLLPEVAPRQLEREDQQYALGGFAGLASNAAALALDSPGEPESGRAPLALRLLEAGRAVLLSQALETRSDLTDLTGQRPDLAARFTHLRNLLDQPPATSTGNRVDDSGGIPSGYERAVRERRRLATDWTDLLVEIRTVPGLASFALPPSIDELTAEATQGPVVVFNVSRFRSDALLLTTSGITSLALRGLRIERVVEQVNTFHQALYAVDHGHTARDRQAAQLRLAEVLQWLWDDAAGPVLEELGYQAPPQSGQEWPRVWWVPGGLLGALPIHAAGYHTAPPDPAARAVMERVISSYTPTVGALRHARHRVATFDRATTGRALIVAMPTTPDVPGRLDYVPDEVGKLAAHLSNSVTLTEPDPSPPSPPDRPAQILSGAAEEGSLPTKDNVLKLLATCSIAHFACHGFSDPTDPSRSRLLLHDHRSNPLTVAALAPVRLNHAQLAYLSACETAVTTHTQLIDEAIHLASAFQLAGYPHVIGTLWAINDFHAAQIADAFYTGLAAGTGNSRTLNIGQAADALHWAVRAVRQALPRTPSLWATYLHAGA